MNQIEIVKQIINDINSLTNVINNEEFYNEFNKRIKIALDINHKEKKILRRNFQYIDKAIEWINEENIDIITIVDAGRFSEGVNVVYRSS